MFRGTFRVFHIVSFYVKRRSDDPQTLPDYLSDYLSNSVKNSMFSRLGLNTLIGISLSVRLIIAVDKWILISTLDNFGALGGFLLVIAYWLRNNAY